METNNKTIAEQFSYGKFSACYDHFADGITWQIVGNTATTGKQEVIAYCDKMMAEMESSVLYNTNVVAENDNVAIEGFCDYMDDDNNPRKVSYCDVYRFEGGKITSITSYCIDKKL